MNIPQTPIVNQMVVFNTQEIQTTNRLGRSKTLERPVKLLEGSDKPKIFQSHEAESLEQVSTFPREESIVLLDNKDNQKGKAVFPNSSEFILREL